MNKKTPASYPFKRVIPPHYHQKGDYEIKEKNGYLWLIYNDSRIEFKDGETIRINPHPFLTTINFCPYCGFNIPKDKE